MPYMKETFVYPGGYEERKYHTWRLGGKKTRRPNERKTDAAVQRGNSRRAKEQLYRLIVTNFRRDDYRLDLTYGDPPPDREEAKRRVRNFLRNLHNLYRKNGEELKYIYVTEYKGHRIHHHVLLNASKKVSRKEIQALWRYGILNYRSFRYFDGAAEDCRRVAEYFVKETDETIREEGAVQRKRWSQSRNLKRPRVKKEKIYSRHWRENPRGRKGFYIAEEESGWTQDGYPYQYIRFKQMKGMVKGVSVREDDVLRGVRNVQGKKSMVQVRLQL